MARRILGSKMITVLIADDKQVLRIGLTHIVNAIAGCKVVAETSDGPKTIDGALVLCPNLIFIRADLPVLDGIKTTQRIKKQLPGTRVIMLLTQASDFLRATESGADGYIMRETPEHLIANAIETVTNGGAWIGPLVAKYLLHEEGLPLLSRVAVETAELPGLHELTVREKEVLRLVAKGLSNKKVADALAIQLETTKVHMRNILKKLKVSGRAEAISKLFRSGLSF